MLSGRMLSLSGQAQTTAWVCTVLLLCVSETRRACASGALTSRTLEASTYNIPRANIPLGRRETAVARRTSFFKPIANVLHVHESERMLVLPNLHESSVCRR